ncbi:threonine/serine exporter family protein [Aerococcus tenax]|nr:threonine/serine exporter family protein [Aerococcus tenax]RAV71621.1 threonine/serine exporter [Aerococcus urinae]RAV91938.1 threonine/serine exporter [Aerococcus tenax]RAW04972.1 threonine/serine exporter [Aerococcus urinae]
MRVNDWPKLSRKEITMAAINEEQNHLLLSTCLLAGKIMMESGSESYRVEDTMQRIAQNSHRFDTASYVTNTAVFMSLNKHSDMQMVLVKKTSTDLAKIDDTNQLSRSYAEGKLNLEELYQALQAVDKQEKTFPFSVQLLAAGAASAAFMLMIDSTNYWDIGFAFAIAIIGFAISEYCKVEFEITFLSDFFATTVIGFLALSLNRLGLVNNLDSLITGCIMPLLPGLAITGALRDLFARQLISGMVQAVNAILIAIVLGVGIALTLQWLG